MKTLCIDSTLIIDFLKGKLEAIEQLQNMKKGNILSTTSINAFEVMFGLLRGKNRRVDEIAERFFNSCQIFDFDFAAAKKSAVIAAGLAEKGAMINEFDTLIAGAMLVNGSATIATANIKDFQRIKEIEVYK
jgi:predicted nucleic acid-binding protein